MSIFFVFVIIVITIIMVVIENKITTVDRALSEWDFATSSVLLASYQPSRIIFTLFHHRPDNRVQVCTERFLPPQFSDHPHYATSRVLATTISDHPETNRPLTGTITHAQQITSTVQKDKDNNKHKDRYNYTDWIPTSSHKRILVGQRFYLGINITKGFISTQFKLTN